MFFSHVLGVRTENVKAHTCSKSLCAYYGQHIRGICEEYLSSSSFVLYYLYITIYYVYLKFFQSNVTPMVKETKDQASGQCELHESAGMIGFLQCMIIHSFGGIYDDKIRVVPMEIPSHDSTTYSLSNKPGDIEDVECLIKNDINKELSFTLYDTPNTQKSKHFYLNSIEALFKESTKSGGTYGCYNTLYTYVTTQSYIPTYILCTYN